jgi:hypothetical protein
VTIWNLAVLLHLWQRYRMVLELKLRKIESFLGGERRYDHSH